MEFTLNKRGRLNWNLKHTVGEEGAGLSGLSSFLERTSFSDEEFGKDIK